MTIKSHLDFIRTVKVLMYAQSINYNPIVPKFLVILPPHGPGGHLHFPVGQSCSMTRERNQFNIHIPSHMRILFTIKTQYY